MTHAYSELYIENAQKVLAHMMHYAVYDIKMDYDSFSRLFVQSGIAEQFGRGNPRYVAGMSGTELAEEVIRHVTGHGSSAEARYYFDRSDAYWTGFTIAWYQWYRDCSFRELFSKVPCSTIASMYRKYHEMDLLHSVEEIDRLRRLSAYHMRLGLKNKRESAGMSQRELAVASGVPIRTIQQYEQRQRDINNAAAITLLQLSKSLHCRMEDLIEP